MDLIGFLYGFGFVQGIMLAGLILYARSGHRLANAFMAALVTCIAIRFLVHWLIRAGVFQDYPQLGLVFSPLDFAWGPLLYLYAYAMTNREVSRFHVLQFVPALLLISAPITFALYPRETQLEFLNYLWSNRDNAEMGRNVLAAIPAFWRPWVEYRLYGILFSLQFGIYCYLVLRQIYGHNVKLEQYFSSTEQMDLRWLRTLTLLCVAFLVLFVVLNRGQIILTGHQAITATTQNLPFLFMVLVIYVIGIAAFNQPSILRGVSQARKASVESTDSRESGPEAVELRADEAGDDVETKGGPPAKYTRSGLSLEDAQQFKKRIIKAMTDKQLFLDCDLTLRALAENVGLSYHQVSQVINGQMNRRFFSFVNGYRVQLAKELMADPKTSHMAIVDLAMEVGFKSKSSFYDAFKSSTQMTPTQFKKTLEATDST